MTDEEVLELFCKCHQEFPFPLADDICTPISIAKSFFILSLQQFVLLIENEIKLI